MSLRVALCSLLLATILAVPSFAQQAGGGGKRNRWGEPSDDDPKYDPKTETTVKGAIWQVRPHFGRRGTPRAVILITVAGGVVEANLGPTSFLDENKLKLTPGDAVTVTGSKVKDGKGERVLGREITVGKQTLVLRSKDGQPKWEERHR